MAGLRRIPIFLCLFFFTRLIGFSQNNLLVDSKVTFKILNADIVANGRFESLHTQIYFDPLRPTATRFSSKIDVESIKTGIRLRDKHLKRPVYFDVNLFPTIEVDLLNIQDLGNGAYNGEFRIRIKGTEQRVRIPFTMKEEGGQYAFEGKFSLNRRDFKVGGKSWTLADLVDVQVRFVVLPLGK